MESIVFNLFGKIYKLVCILIVTGTIGTVLSDLQVWSFHSQHIGLVSMYSINKQLVGETSHKSRH